MLKQCGSLQYQSMTSVRTTSMIKDANVIPRSAGTQHQSCSHLSAKADRAAQSYAAVACRAGLKTCSDGQQSTESFDTCRTSLMRWSQNYTPRTHGRQRPNNHTSQDNMSTSMRFWHAICRDAGHKTNDVQNTSKKCESCKYLCSAHMTVRPTQPS